MKRRSFFATVSGLVAAQFVPKAAAKPAPDIDKVLIEMQRLAGIVGSPSRLTATEAMYKYRVYHSWTNDGRVTEHDEHPGDRPDSFVVAVDKYRHGIRLP